MPTHRSLADIAAEISSSGLPALFIDTCAMLDVVRCAARKQSRIAGITRQLIGGQTSGELLLFAPSVLHKEDARNRVDVESDARKCARAIDDAIVHHRRVADTLGSPYPCTGPFSHESLVGPLVNLHDQLMDTCVYALADQATAMAALARAGDNRRPARKGGGVNDCILFEEFLSIARAAPTANTLILLTTNTNDFGDKNSQTGVHVSLTAELVSTTARICLSWDETAAAVLSSPRCKLI